MRRNNHKKFVNGGGKEVEVVAQNNFYHRIPMNILIIFIHNLKATKSAIDGCLVWGKVLRCRSRWWWERNLINYSILWDGEGTNCFRMSTKKSLCSLRCYADKCRLWSNFLCHSFVSLDKIFVENSPSLKWSMKDENDEARKMKENCWAPRFSSDS